MTQLAASRSIHYVVLDNNPSSEALRSQTCEHTCVPSLHQCCTNMLHLEWLNNDSGFPPLAKHYCLLFHWTTTCGPPSIRPSWSESGRPQPGADRPAQCNCHRGCVTLLTILSSQ